MMPGVRRIVALVNGRGACTNFDACFRLFAGQTRTETKREAICLK